MHSFFDCSRIFFKRHIHPSLIRQIQLDIFAKKDTTLQVKNLNCIDCDEFFEKKSCKMNIYKNEFSLYNIIPLEKDRRLSDFSAVRALKHNPASFLRNINLMVSTRRKEPWLCFFIILFTLFRIGIPFFRLHRKAILRKQG